MILEGLCQRRVTIKKTCVILEIISNLEELDTNSKRKLILKSKFLWSVSKASHTKWPCLPMATISYLKHFIYSKEAFDFKIKIHCPISRVMSDSLIEYFIWSVTLKQNKKQTKNTPCKQLDPANLNFTVWNWSQSFHLKTKLLQSRHRHNNWLLQKKIKQGGLRIWNFHRWSRKGCVEFSWVLVFGLGNPNGCNTILWNFQGWSVILSGISKGKVTNLKVPEVFFKKVCPQSTHPSALLPVWIFSGIDQLRISLVFLKSTLAFARLPLKMKEIIQQKESIRTF